MNSKSAGRFLFLGLAITTTAFSIACNTLPEESAVSITPSTFDFSTIVQSDGPISTTFSVENTGDDVLIINRLSTSCGCTTAEMDQSDMMPGEQRLMTVTFDPRVHEDQFGHIERVVYLQTSDPIQPEVEIDITAFVTQ